MSTKPKNDWERNNIQFQSLLKAGRLDKYLQHKEHPIFGDLLLSNGSVYEDVFDDLCRFEMLVQPMVYNKDITDSCLLSVAEIIFHKIKEEHHCITRKNTGMGVIMYHIYGEDHDFQHGIHNLEYNISIMDLLIDMERLTTYKPILKNK